MTNGKTRGTIAEGVDEDNAEVYLPQLHKAAGEHLLSLTIPVKKSKKEAEASDEEKKEEIDL